VSTSIGASGLNAHPGENILIADTAHDFADAIAQLLDDPRLATRIAAKGLETFVRDHSQQRIDADVARVVQQVLGGTSGHAQ
jgi:glycosyltransferase involved in cell wall biosynthesis